MIAGTAAAVAVAADGDENFLPFFPAISHVRILGFGLKKMKKEKNRNVFCAAAAGAAVVPVPVLSLVLGPYLTLNRIAEKVVDEVGLFGE